MILRDKKLEKDSGQLFLKSTIDTYTKILYNFVRRFGFSDGDTEDILQTIFIKIWKNQDSFDKEKASLKTWIFTIAKNTIYDALRKNKRSKPILSLDKENEENNLENLEDISHDIVQLLERLEIKNKVLDAINSLNEDEKVILLLHVEESLTFNELAIIFESPSNTIKSKYRRSLLKLKLVLEEMHQNKN